MQNKMARQQVVLCALTLFFGQFFPTLGFSYEDLDTEILVQETREIGQSLERERLSLEQLLELEKRYEKENTFRKSKRPKYVKWSEIKSWDPLGNRYAAGLDENGNMLAIYDLALPYRKSWAFLKRTFLGSIGIGDLNLRWIFKQIIERIKERRAERRRRRDQRRSDRHLTDDMKVQAKLDKKDEKRDKKHFRYINRLDRKYGNRDVGLPKNWWKKVPWKENFEKGLYGEPESFKISDIDFNKISVRKKKKFTRRMASARTRFKKYFDMDMEKDFFDRFEFVKRAGKGYDIYMRGAKKRDPNKQDRPEKMIDLRRFESTFGRKLAKTLINELFNQLAKAVPYVGTFLEIVVERWFDLWEEQRENHRTAALEFVEAAERGAPDSPFASLTKDQRIRAAVFVTSHNSNIMSHMIKKRREKWWRAEMVKRDINRSENLDYLSKKGYTLNSMSHFFTFGERGKRGKAQKKIFSLGDQINMTHRPYTALDYKKPHYIRVKRNLIEAADLVLELVEMPIPGALTVIKMLYNFLVKRNVKKSKSEEARLVNNLNNWSHKNGTDWNWEIDIIHAQRLNPFELDRGEEQKFMLRSKALIGI